MVIETVPPLYAPPEAPPFIVGPVRPAKGIELAVSPGIYRDSRLFYMRLGGQVSPSGQDVKRGNTQWSNLLDLRDASELVITPTELSLNWLNEEIFTLLPGGGVRIAPWLGGGNTPHDTKDKKFVFENTAYSSNLGFASKANKAFPYYFRLALPTFNTAINLKLRENNFDLIRALIQQHIAEFLEQPQRDYAKFESQIRAIVNPTLEFED